MINLIYSNLTGYEVMEVFSDSLNHFRHAQTSQIYKELQVLEKMLGEQAGYISDRKAQ